MSNRMVEGLVLSSQDMSAVTNHVLIPWALDEGSGAAFAPREAEGLGAIAQSVALLVAHRLIGRSLAMITRHVL